MVARISRTQMSDWQGSVKMEQMTEFQSGTEERIQRSVVESTFQFRNKKKCGIYPQCMSHIRAPIRMLNGDFVEKRKGISLYACLFVLLDSNFYRNTKHDRIFEYIFKLKWSLLKVTTMLHFYRDTYIPDEHIYKIYYALYILCLCDEHIYTYTQYNIIAHNK